MSNGSTIPTVGSWVQYNVTAQSPLSGLPTAAENTIGIVRQVFCTQGKQMIQVVWNPGAMLPETGLYTEDQLCQITSQQAANIQAQMNAGTYDPTKPQGTPGSNYQQPAIPNNALPPGLQSVPVIPTLTGPTNQPLSSGVGYQ